MQRRHSIVLASALLVGSAALSGCGTGDARLDDIRSDPSPDIDTLYQRPVDIGNSITLTFDENFRMFTEDLGRLMLFDRPSKLAREPVPRP